jgi:ataxin-10
MGAKPECKLTIYSYTLRVVSKTLDRRLLTKSKVGVRVCIALLDNMVRLHEAEEGTDAAKAFDIG